MASIDQVPIAGLSEPVTIAELCRTRCAGVPTNAGIYLIERRSDDRPVFVSSTGGWFKDQDPNCSSDVVRSNWVDDTHIVYIGKAAGKKGLRRRLTQLIDFGCGKPVGHRGGRLLWHLEDNKELLVRWLTCPAHEAERAETAAIASFKESHDGMRPFANMNK
jgi:hypothetical protein